MNFVSVLIYLADVLQSLDYISIFLMIVTLIVGIGMTVAWFGDSSEDRPYDTKEGYDKAFALWSARLDDHYANRTYRDHPGPEPKYAPPSNESAKPAYLGYMKKPFIALAALCLINVVTPSAITVYAIAASQAAEKVLVSPTVNKAVNALNRWLDKQAK